MNWGQAGEPVDNDFLSRIHPVSIQALFRLYALAKHLIRLRFTGLSTENEALNYYYYPELTAFN
jgi:hypothetical protein